MKIRIFEDYTYRVSWYDEEDGEGVSIGQEHPCRSPSAFDAEIEKAKKNRSRDGYNHFKFLVVERAARVWFEEQVANGADVHVGMFAYEMGSRNLAASLLTVARAAVKQAKAEWTANVPWPEWAKTALANGWKPPKGWKP